MSFDRMKEGIGKNIIRRGCFALPVNIFSAFRFSYGKHRGVAHALASEKGYQRLAAFFSDPKSGTGERWYFRRQSNHIILESRDIFTRNYTDSHDQ